MNKYYGIGVVLIVLILLGAGMFSQLGIFTDTVYDTDTRVTEKTWYAYNDPTKYHSYGYISENEELIAPEKIALAWSDESYSETISLNQVGLRPGHKRSLLPLVVDNPRFSNYWYQVEVYKDGNWITLFDEDGKVYTNLISETSIPWGSSRWNDIYMSNYWEVQGIYINDPESECHSTDTNDRPFWYIVDKYDSFREDPNAIEHIMSIPNSFRIRGNDLAGSFLRVSLCSYFATHAWEGKYCSLETWVIDDVVLASGTGDIAIGASPHGGTVFEEGDKIDFTVKTGYAGASGSTTPWMVELHEPGGEVAVGRNIVVKDGAGTVVLDTGTTKVARFYLKNDLSYKPFSWTIGDGTVKDTDAAYGHNWHFYLKNTITEEDDEWVFIVQEGMAKCGPINVDGILDISGSSITLTVEADGNTVCGAGDVDYFIIRMLADGSLYTEEKWDAYYSTTHGRWRQTDTFNFPYTDKLYECEVKAFDTNGLPSLDTWGDTGWVGGDDTASLNFIVNFDGNPAQCAIVNIQGETIITNTYGRCSIALPIDQSYNVDVSYKGTSQSRLVFLDTNGQTEIFNLGMSTELIISALIIVIIMVLAIIMAIVIPIHIAFRIMIIMIGAMVSVFVYLVMNGYIL